MKETITRLIPIAIKAIEKTQIPENNGILSQYHGYVSSLGAGIIQSGLLPAVIFFENSEGEADKYKVTNAIRWLIESAEGKVTVSAQAEKPEYKLSEYILADSTRKSDPAFLKKVTTYAIAIKIAMRTFKKIKS